MLFIALLVIGVACGDSPVEGDERGFDQEQIDELKGSSKYDYDKTIEPYSSPILKFFGNLFIQIMKLLSYSITYVIIGLVVLAIIIIIIRNSNQRFSLPERRKTSEIKIVHAEDLEQTDYRKLLEQALAGNDLRSATRFTFLLALQHLQLRKHIKWHKEKTNYQYLYELKPELQEPYSHLTRVYEYVWYGEADIDKELFDKLNGYYKYLKQLAP